MQPAARSADRPFPSGHRGPGWLHRLDGDPSMRLLLGFAAFVMAVMLLSGFYVVIQQGMARGHAQWVKASRMVPGCEARGGIGADCLTSTASVKVGQVASVR